MTIRELFVSLGYKIDEKSEKKVNESIDGLKSFASGALGKTGVGFDVDEQSKQKAQNAIAAIEQAASKLKENVIGFDADEASKKEVIIGIEKIQDALGALEEKTISYETDGSSKKAVLDSIKDIQAAISHLKENAVAFETDQQSKQALLGSIAEIEQAAEQLDIDVGVKIDENALKFVFECIDELYAAAQTLRNSDVGFEVDASSKSLVFDSVDELKKASAQLESNDVRFKVDRQSEQEAVNAIKRIRSFAVKALGVIGIGFSLFALNRLSEEFGSVNDQIRDATRGMGDQEEIQQRILRAANETRQSYAAMANTVNRLVRTGAFEGVEDAAQFATLMAKDFAAAGKSQYQSAYLTRNITMDLQQGVVSARTINTMFRDAPHMVDALARSAGVAAEDLKDLARGGAVTADMLKNSLLESADDIHARFAEVDMTVSDALTNVRNEWGMFVSDMDSTLGLSRAVARGIVNGFNQVLFVLRRLQDAFMRVADRLGGVQNLMRLLAIAAGAILIAFKGPAILKLLQQIGRGLMRINFKILAIVAIFVILALIVEDFIAFMRGDDSLLGKMLENAGIDAEAVRETIINAWQAIRGFLTSTWNFLRNLGRRIWGGLQNFWEEHGDRVKEVLSVIWETIRDTLEAVWDTIKEVAMTVFNVLRDFWDEWGAAIFETFLDVFLGILNFIENVFLGNWSEAFGDIRDIARSVFGLLNDMFGDFAPYVWAAVAALSAYKAAVAAAAVKAKGLTVAKGVLTVATKLLNAAKKMNPIGLIIGLIAGLVAAFVTLWENNEGFRNFFIGMWEGIKGFFTGIVDFFRNAIDGIVEFFTGGGNVISDVFMNILNTVTSVIDSIRQVIDGIIDFIAGVFTGDWERAWNGIRDIFSGIVNGLAAIFKMPINHIISLVNSFIRGLNRLTIPDWVPGVGGKGINIPEIPKLAKGSDFSPDTFIAGEEGPELVTNAKGSKVFTAAETADTLGKLNALSNWQPPELPDGTSYFKDGGGLAGWMRGLAKAMAFPASEAVQVYHSHVENKYITLHNDFYNEFHGDRAGQEKSAAAMDRASDDAVGVLARALAYG